MPRKKKIDPRVKYYPARLMEQLSYIRSYPVSLLEAPSGFGKTTLLEHFLDVGLPRGILRRRYEFVRDSSRDGWRHFCAMISQVDADCARRLETIGPPSEDTLPEIARTFLALECREETYLWLDDFMNWDLECPGKFLEMLSRYEKKELHIIISTQPLPREKMKGFTGRGNVWRLSEQSFLFRTEEIENYFLSAGISLTPMQVEEVERLSEGWIMALSLQMTNYVANSEFHPGGMDELMETVFWSRCSFVEKNFLLEISIFPRFTLAQAAGFSKMSLEETEKLLMDQRYFVHYDPENRYYYLHSQLRRMLAVHFETLSPERKRDIYLRGGALAEEGKDRLQTLQFYYASGEWERLYAMSLNSYDIADIADEHTGPMILDLLENAPREMKKTIPER